MDLSEKLRVFLSNLFTKLVKVPELASLLTTITMIIYWILLATIIFKIVKFIVKKSQSFGKFKEHKETKEQETVRRLINNIIRALFVFWIVIMILRELGIDVVPVLAGAGVLAFAVGFGAQELIKDVISGMFIIMERTLKIDDLVEINGLKGRVQDVGIRRTKLLTWKNELVILNNGDIKTVLNFTNDFSVAVVEFTLDYNFDVNLLYTDKFKEFLEEFLEANEEVIEVPSLPVILDLNNSINFRITIKTNPNKNSSVERIFRKDLYRYFNENDITIGIPLVVESK